MTAMKSFMAILFLGLPMFAWSQAEDGDDYVPPIQLTEEEWAEAETDTLELDPLEVTGAGWTYQQEVTLRFLRSAYKKPKSPRIEDRDVWVCWIDEATGSTSSGTDTGRLKKV